MISSHDGWLAASDGVRGWLWEENGGALKPGPLDGISARDLTQDVAGPYCKKLLAGHRTDVSKVEAANEGNSSRRLGPFGGGDEHLERSIPFPYMNTRKRDITLNSDLLDAVGLVRDLASTVVLLIEYPAPNERVRLGSSYEQYCGYNPTLVFCSVTEIST